MPLSLSAAAKAALTLRGVTGTVTAETGLTLRRPSRKQPQRMAMGAPVSAQHFQGGLGQGHIAILAAFALAHMQHAAAAVNVANLQIHAFPNA